MPEAVSPHVEAAPAVSDANVTPPDTGLGAVAVSVVPFPSCPEKLEPQQYAEPPGSRPHACCSPTVIVTYLRLPLTGCGPRAPEAVSFPMTFPQQEARLSLARPQVR